MKIQNIEGFEVIDSRGNPTVAARVNLEGSISALAMVPSGAVISKELIVRDTGSITGSIEADNVEIHGHLDGKVTAQNIVIGATGTVKGDVEFGVNLRTENGADIDGYIKKTTSSKSKLTDGFLFNKKDKKESSTSTDSSEDRPEVVNKEAIA